ncbi:hypothetical protein [Mycoplasmopsis bovis]
MSKKAKLILFPILGTVGVAATVTPFAVLSIKKSNNNKITPAENSKIVNY